MTKLWGGRFGKETAGLARQFNDSYAFDQRLAQHDITGSQAWAQALFDAGIITNAECNALYTGLEQVRAEFTAGTFTVQPGDEDIHTAVERRLTELVGPVGGKLHTGRSRNDQVATDIRLWLLDAHSRLCERQKQLIETLINRAGEHLATPMPGFTHLQHAQPVTVGHWLLSHTWPLLRDAHRFRQWRDRTSTLPLGSGALAGTAYPIDRQALANELGFLTVTPNSIDAVSDRDFAAEFLFVAALIGIHISRLAEQIIIYSTPEFGFIALDDAYSTGSSLMPQKKNPDMLELARGKSGRLLGHLTGLLATLKALPSAYDKDLQEDKEPLFDAFDTLDVLLPVMSAVIDTMQVNPAALQARLDPGLLATDLADHLVQHHAIPFREAHHIVGHCVQAAEQAGLPLDQLPADTLASIHPALTPALMREVFDWQRALERRNAVGGTSAAALRAQLAAARQSLNTFFTT